MTWTYFRRSGAFAAALALLAGSPNASWAQDAASSATITPADAAAAHAWDIDDTDLPVDADVRFGVLPNGMKYALQRNTTPRSAIAMRLRFDVGSLFEGEDERGIAHFLEHMAFNGSTNVAEGEMVRLLERSGLAFGADTNASTGFDSTTYQLDLPTNGEALVDTALMLFAETAHELTLAADAIDRERGVVISEMRTRDNYALRDQVDQLQFALAGTIIPDRMPIGTEERLQNLTAAQMRSFYDRYYRPERATLVITGDFDVAAMEARIIARFAGWTGRGDAGAEPDLGQVDFARGAAADIYTHPALSETVTIAWFKPWEERADTQALRQQLLLETIGERILRRRFSRIALASDAPISGASFGETGAFDLVRSASLSARARDGQWRAAMTVLDQEFRRAMQYGFTSAEVAEQLASLRTGFQNAVASAATRHSGGLASRLLGAADGDSVVTSPATDRALFEGMAERITPDSVTAAFRTMMQGFGAPLMRVTSKTAIDGAEAALLAAFADSGRVAVAPPAEQDAAAFAYVDFGAAGTVISDDRITDLDIRRVRFANGVMLNIKRTDFAADRVAVQVRINGGGQLATRDDPTRVALTPLMTLGGLEAHSADQLQSILAGQSVSRSFGATGDSFVMGGTTPPQSLLLQFQVYAATLTHPGYRTEAINLFRRVLPDQYAAMDATPSAALSRDIGAILTNDDVLSRTPPLDAMLALDWEPYRAAIAASLGQGAIEIGVVGDVDEDAAIAAVAATFGALPPRQAGFVRDPAAFERRFAEDRSLRTLTHRGEAEQAIVQSYWSARDDSDLAETVQIHLLGAVMEIMLTEQLREQLGQTYSPGAGSSLSSDYPGYGYLFASASVAVGDISSVESAIASTAASLRDGAISADLLDRARRPILEGLTQARRNNGYWLGYVARATSDAARLDRSRNAPALYAAVTPADILAMAQRYLTDDRRLQIRVVPAERAAANP